MVPGHVFAHARHKLSVEAIWDLLRLELLLLVLLLLLLLLLEQPRGMRTRGGRLLSRGRCGGGGVVIDLKKGVECMNDG